MTSPSENEQEITNLEGMNQESRITTATRNNNFTRNSGNNDNRQNAQRLRLNLLHPHDATLEGASIIRRLVETSLFNLTDENFREAAEDMMDETYLVYPTLGFGEGAVIL